MHTVQKEGIQYPVYIIQKIHSPGGILPRKKVYSPKLMYNTKDTPTRRYTAQKKGTEYSPELIYTKGKHS
jgi:hypothetical protein